MFTCTAWYISVLLIANFYKFLSIKSFALVSSAFDHAMKFRCVHEQECQIRLYRLYHQIIFIRIDKSLVNVFCPFFREQSNNDLYELYKSTNFQTAYWHVEARFVLTDCYFLSCILSNHGRSYPSCTSYFLHWVGTDYLLVLNYYKK